MSGFSVDGGGTCMQASKQNKTHSHRQYSSNSKTKYRTEETASHI